MANDQANDIDGRLKLLEDKQAIYDVIMRYCRGVDRVEPELILSAFHDDATDNHFGVVLPFREAIGTLKMARAPGDGPPPGGLSMHSICNVLIELDGDVARCESYLVAVNRLEQEGQSIDWTLAGRYVDRFERRNGSWRIAHRTVVYDLERFDEVVPPQEGLGPASYTAKAVRGQRGRGDFSYEIFSSTKA
jgi:hypothetical protein